MRPYLKACVPSKLKGITATSDPSLRLSLLTDEQEVSLGEFVEGRIKYIQQINREKDPNATDTQT